MYKRRNIFFTFCFLFFSYFSSNSLPIANRTIFSFRQEICLNGLWNFAPAEGKDRFPTKNEWGSIWVPGAWTQEAWWTLCPGIETKGSGKVWDANLAELNKAWYQKTFNIPEDWKSSAVILDFRRISTDAQIYIDGKKAGAINWPGGEIEITNLVKPGKAHELRALVLSSANQKEVLDFMGTANAQISVRQAKLCSKGIIGEVFLKSRPLKTYISDVFIQTSVRQNEITLDVEFTGIKQADRVKLIASVENEQGKQEKQFEAIVILNPDSIQRKSIKWKWDNPRLWDLDQPKLYNLKLKAESVQIQDVYIQEFGFREFWIEGKDFYLNNKKINLRPTSNTLGGGNYVLTDAAISGLRKAGYNFFEIWPQNIDQRGMLQYNEIFMDRADRKGVLISAPLPPAVPYIMNTNWQYQWNDPGQKNVWESRMAKEIRRVRNHPSIVMWGINPNFFGHSEDQNPQVIGQHGWIKEDLGWQTNQQAADESVEIIKKHDTTRPVFNHHGAYTGDVHTLNFYLCLTPLQERIEWLSHYSKFGNMPFMGIEFGTPLENTMLRGRCPFGESIVTEPLFTEYAAIYQGRKAYESETPQYRSEIQKRFLGGQKYQGWQNNYATNTLPSFQNLQNIFNKETWRAYRTWGISGGMVPWSDAHGWRRKPEAEEFVNMPKFLEGERGVYYKQVTKGDLHYFDSEYWEILPSAKALIESNQETLAWIAGSQEQFTEKSHNFSTGQTVPKQIVLINDSREALGFQYKVSVILEKKVIFSSIKKGLIGWAEVIKEPLHFKIPDTLSLDKSEGKMILEATIGNNKHQDTLEFGAFAPVHAEKQSVVCFDPVQKTSGILRKMGYETLDWTGDLSVPFLVVGREALSGYFSAPANLKEYVSRGGRLLIMSQKPEWFESIGFRVAKHLPRYVYGVGKNHPVLAGLDDLDLRDWNGQSSLVEAYPDYLNRPIKVGMYGVPYYGWHWGNQGALSGAAIEKPHLSGWKPILECEFDLAYSPLMELSLGNGSVTLCTLDLEDYYQRDPVAEKLTNQLLQYAATNDLHPRLKNVSYLGDDEGRLQLSKMGLIFTPVDKVDPSAKLLIVGKGIERNLGEIENYLTSGGKVLFLSRDNSEKILGVSFKQVSDFSGSLDSPEWKETAGLSVSDLHYRTGIASCLIDSGCEIASGGLIGRKNMGKGQAIFCQINPEGFPTDSLTYFRQTRWRQTRVLAQILANMGATFQSDDLILNSLEMPAEINLAGEWKARLMEKMPVTLSVVGGNEDQGISPQAKLLCGENIDEQTMQTVRVPMEMERYGKGWADANGEVVFRKTIDIPENMVGKDLELDLGVVDDFDETYFNGQLVGKVDKSYEEYWGFERKYRIQASLVKSGKNVIAMRVFDRYGKGGLLGSEKPMTLRVRQSNQSDGFYHPDYRTDFKLGDDPYRYFRW